MSHYILDIETNNLLANMLDFSSLPYKLKPSAKLWCVVIRNVETNEVKKACKEEITKEWMQEALADCTHLGAHNGIKFDFIVLKLFGVLDYCIGYLDQPDTLFGKSVTFVDTIILSRLFNPDRYGGHSLDSWGERLGNHKTDFRQVCIDEGLILKTDPKGAEFLVFSDSIVSYCEQDTSTNKDVYIVLLNEWQQYSGWTQAIKMENKLADLAVRRESFGFWFDKELAIKCLADLTIKMDDLTSKVNPLLPPKPLTKVELNKFTPPKTQFKKDGSPSSNLIKFIAQIGGELILDNDSPTLLYKGRKIKLPSEEPVEHFCEADIANLDHVKMYLIDLGWVPTEWRERDLTKDSKKQELSYDKRVLALKRWCADTLAGKYKQERLEFLELTEDNVYESLVARLNDTWPVRVPTSPCVRVGVEKDLCPNLVKLGEKVDFANDFALFLTYKHRKSSIAGGDIEDMDFDVEFPNTGFLSVYREEDGRVPTPAIEIGASTCRYRHISITNIARASSIYGKEMRSLFGCGNNAKQLGFDFSSLENRIQGNYVFKYPGGPELAETLIAEKPNDLHTITGLRLGIPRVDAKSVVYALLYGASPNKIAKMLKISKLDAKVICDDFWNSVPALKMLKENLEKHWESNDKKWIRGIDGRQIRTRSKHSLLNSLFQSGGVICAKYVTVDLMKKLEDEGIKIDVFKYVPEVCSMCEYHDECQIYIDLPLEFKVFKDNENPEDFITNWQGDGQLSTVSNGKDDIEFITLPNIVSKSIDSAISEVGKLLDLKVLLGFEWVVNKTWYGCH